MRRWSPVSGVLSIMLLLSIGPVRSNVGNDTLQATIYGLVLEEETRNPEAGALVLTSKLDETGTFSTRTDVWGFYQFGTEIAEGCWVVQAFNEQGLSQSETVHCTGAAPVEVATLCIESRWLPQSMTLEPGQSTVIGPEFRVAQ